MKFTNTKLEGVWLVDTEPVEDDRGFFARVYCEREFGEHGLENHFVQHSVSFSPKAHTLRGLHFQLEPFAETKLVRCTRGAAFDVVVDLRPDSATYLDHLTVDLSCDSFQAVYIPPGLAHGHLTVAADTEISYLISEFYDSSSARGVRWDDAAFGIDWPAAPSVISPRDATYPNYVVGS